MTAQIIRLALPFRALRDLNHARRLGDLRLLLDYRDTVKAIAESPLILPAMRERCARECMPSCSSFPTDQFTDGEPV